MTDGLSVNVKRFGAEAAPPERRELRAGRLTAVLENADLRYVSLGATHLVLRLYVAIRNRNWDTIEPRFTRFEVDDRGDSFRVELSAENVAGDVDFAWEGVIEGSADGTIRYTMDGAPRQPFLRNRIGFCLLHPMSLAGTPVTVETPDGMVEASFPEQISPHQPFMDMVAMRHAAGDGTDVTVRFEGDLFEAEDQRNWTDASYKTYSTPLRLPYPVEVTPDDRIHQAITISVSGASQGSATAAENRPSADVTVELDHLHALPAIGFGTGKLPLSDDQVEQVQALRPAHLWVDLDLGKDGWLERLMTAAASAAQLGVPLDLSVVGREENEGWDDLGSRVIAEGIRIGRVFAFPPEQRPLQFPRSDLETHAETIAAARRAFGDSGIAVGGGTRAYFTELNRASERLPVAELNVVTYTVNPTVHAVDTLSVIETLAAQAETVTSAREIVGDKPLVVGPITLKPRFNPNATAEPPPPGPDQLPDSVDPRQLSLLGAGWTLGSIHRLATAGAEALTYYELTGWRGLMELESGLTRRDLFPSIPGGLFPLYHVFAAIASFGEGQVAEVQLADELSVEALTLRDGDRIRLLVASFANEEREVRIDVPGLRDTTVRILDETTYEAAVGDPAFFTGAGEPIKFADGVTLTMRPFAVARVDGRL